MDDSYPKPALLIGDLVRCVYDLYPYYYPLQSYGHGAEDLSVKYGVILEIDYTKYGEIFGYETLYLIMCTDGITRYFTEYEVQKIS